MALLTLGDLHHPAGHGREHGAPGLRWFTLFASMYNGVHIPLHITLTLVKYRKNEKSQIEPIYLKLIVTAAQHNPCGIK